MDDKLMELKKGLIIEADYTFIVVRVIYDNGNVYLDCIDSHANNIHCLELHRLKNAKLIDPSEYSCEHDALKNVGEVLAGQHNDRFDHWHNDG